MDLKFLRKLDAFLRNSDSIEDRFDHPIRDPWYTRVYWFVYRNGRRVYNSPSDTYYAIKYFIQRGSRGWADRDTWSLDWYLSGWMPAALRRLRDRKIGTPMSMFEGLPFDDTGNPTDEACKTASDRWNVVITQIIEGFDASMRMLDGLYEKELGEYPLTCPDGISRDAWDSVHHDRMAAVRLLEERDDKLFREGMKLFAEHYFSLWD